MKCITLITFLSFLMVGYSKGQDNRIKSDDCIYWQPDVYVEFADFQQHADSSFYQKCKELWVNSLATVEIHVVMDEPVRNRGFQIKKEKVYLAPVFCIKQSCRINDMEQELEFARVQLDIAEWCARQTRKRIKELENIKSARGLVKDSLPNMVDEMYQSFSNLNGAFMEQVIVKKKEGAFDRWRKKCDQLLKETNRFATTADECNRFINEAPYSEDYKESFKMLEK
jgi:hypothetical protein